jgi:hypothetical protein
MKQQKLVQKVYKACFRHDAEKIYALRKKEFEKIFKHRAEGKSFGSKWTIIRI